MKQMTGTIGNGMSFYAKRQILDELLSNKKVVVTDPKNESYKHNKKTTKNKI